MTQHVFRFRQVLSPVLIVRYFLSFLLPPLAVLLCGKPLLSILNVVLTVCGWFPGVIHALLVVNDHKSDVRAQSYGTFV